MAKFDKVAAKKMMVRFLELDGKTNIWTTCSKAVKGFAENTFKSGDTVDVQFDKQGELGYHVTRITKGNGIDTSTTTQKEDNTPKCEDCGKELKDAKYKKCYMCNKKNPTPKTATTSTTSENKATYGYKSPEVQDSIKRQAIGHMTSRTLIALQGHVDPNNVTELAEIIYKKYTELVG